MARNLSRSPKTFFVAIAVTMVVAFLPTKWLGWTNDLSEIVRLFVQPFGRAGIYVATWLRPDPYPGQDLPENGEDLILRLSEDNERYKALYRRAQSRIADLEEQLEQLQQAELSSPRTEIRFITAGVTGHNPNRPSDVVELSRGTRFGVREGTVAVYNGVHIIGRVTRVSLFASWLLPVTSRASGLIRALVYPKGRPEATIRDAAVIQLEPQGDGTFIADLSREVKVAEGDLVSLADPAWPEAAQAMLLGTVESVRVKDQDLLRNTLVVRPRHQAHYLRYVTLKVELEEALVGGAGP